MGSKERKLKGVIRLSEEGGGTCSYLGRCDEFATAQDLLTAIVKEDGAEVLDYFDRLGGLKVRRTYARVSMNAMLDPTWHTWCMEEYNTSGRGRFEVWWLDL